MNKHFETGFLKAALSAEGAAAGGAGLYGAASGAVPGAVLGGLTGLAQVAGGNKKGLGHVLKQGLKGGAVGALGLGALAALLGGGGVAALRNAGS